MKKINQWLALAGVTLTLALAGNQAAAQPGGGPGGGGGRGGGFGGMDMTQIIQMQVEQMRPDLAVTNDADWNAIAPLLTKVVQLRLESSISGMGAMMRNRGGGRGGGLAAMLGGQTDPAAEALQKAIDDKAPIADVKAAMARLRDSRKAKQAEVAKAQAALKDVLTTRQEAVLVNFGMLE